MTGETLDYLTTAVVELDETLGIGYLNPAAEALLAISARHAVGTAFAELVPGGAGLVERLHTAIRDNQPWTARELTLPLAQGQPPVTVDLAVSPLGEPVSGLLLELSPLDRHLRISREEALHSQHAVSRALVRGLAHEIKNPLGGLRGAAQLLARRLDDPELREYTRVIISEADRLGRLVDSMLGPTRPPQRIEVNIHSVAEDVAKLVAAEHPGLALERDYDPSLPPARGDPGLLTQALLNLARNAAQAAGPAGAVSLRTRALRQVTIGGHRHRLALAIEVIDDGPGIPAELLDQVFFPLVSAREGGSGLGLTIAQSLVNRHGGLIEHAREGGRTVFRLLLPVEDANAHAA